MTLHFVGGMKCEVLVEKETKQYMTIKCLSSYGQRYRVNKQTGEVQNINYHYVIKGLHLEP